MLAHQSIDTADDIAREALLLRPLLIRKRFAIPFAVPTWLYFKHHVIEKPTVLAAFQAAPPDLDLASFKELLIQHAPPQVYAPARARGSPRSSGNTKTRLFWDLLHALYDEFYPALLNPCTSLFSVRPSQQYGGLGLFARRTIILEARSVVPGGITGTLHAVAPDEWNRLVSMRYPSLFSDSAADGILTGPLALANHDCRSHIGLRRRRGEDKVTVEAVAHEPVVLAAGSELVIHYGSTLGFDCRCGGCNIR